MEILEALQAVRDVYVNYPKRYEEIKDGIKRCELEIEDLEHLMEFAKLNASQGYQMYKAMKEVRKRRRELKNELELLEISKRINNAGKPNEKILNQAIGDMRKVIKQQNDRCYSMRVRHDLQELIK